MNVKRIAMWSGPRNLSTALMRSFASRNDCSVVDEPFYAAYLKVSGRDHPMKDLILKTYDVAPERVSHDCVSGGAITKLQYQKHMTHHMLNMFDRSFIYSMDNAFLIRSPEKVIRSFGKNSKSLVFRIYSRYVNKSKNKFSKILFQPTISPSFNPQPHSML